MSRFSTITTVGLIACMATEALASGNAAKHDWQHDPTTEGWTLVDDSEGAHQFFKTTDTMQTWKIDTKTNGGSGIGVYQDFSDPGDYWQAVVEVNLIDADAGGGQAVRIAYDNRVFGMQFSTAPDGDPIISLEGSSFSMEIDGGAGDYHRYVLTVDHRVPSSRLSIDDQFGHTGYFGFLTDPGGNLPGIEFGDLNPSGSVNGDANWGQVKLVDLIPEPSSMVALVFGAAALPVRRKARKGRPLGTDRR